MNNDVSLMREAQEKTTVDKKIYLEKIKSQTRDIKSAEAEIYRQISTDIDLVMKESIKFNIDLYSIVAAASQLEKWYRMKTRYIKKVCCIASSVGHTHEDLAIKKVLIDKVESELHREANCKITAWREILKDLTVKVGE